jgi:hypothetical protein
MAISEFDRVVGEYLRYWIRRSGLTTEQVAERTGVNAETVRRHARGVTRMTWYQVARYDLVMPGLADGLPRLDSNQQPTGYGVAA